MSSRPCIGIGKKYSIILALFICGALIQCRKGSVPSANLSIKPIIGTINTLFDLDASATTDSSSLPQLIEYRWDYEGDGIWDTDFKHLALAAHRYLIPGTYNPTVEVLNIEGLSQTKSVQIQVDSLQSFVDSRDGKRYPMVQIGDDWWMAKNLDYGRIIPPEQEQTNNGIVEKYRYPGEDHDSLFGGLYQWFEVMNYKTIEGSQGICPPGWHVPGDLEWNKMVWKFRDPRNDPVITYYLDSSRFYRGGWIFHDIYEATGAIWKLLRETGSTGFDAILLGYRDPDGQFGDQDYHFTGKTASFWTSTRKADYALRARFYVTSGNQGDLFRFSDNINYGFSVRCVKNAN